ncbi:MAG: addiction module protein [Planctomycetota bacterium]
MSEARERLLAQALRLSADERAVQAAELWASLETESDPGIEAAWAEEVQRRLQGIESGEDRTLPWEEVRAHLRARFSG